MTASSLSLSQQLFRRRPVAGAPVGGIARVFLGSRGSKIMRHSPVPVLVLAG
jgi:hypothetical protein